MLRALIVMLMSSTLLPAAAASQPPAQDPPCGACIAAVVTPAQALALPPRLAGITVLVSVAAGDERRARASLLDIAARGGRPGIQIDGLPSASFMADPDRAAGVILIRPRADETHLDADRLAYELKTLATAARAMTGSDVQIGIGGTPGALRALVQRDLGPYVDFVASSSPIPSSKALDVWQTIEAATLREALARTRTGSAARWLWTIPMRPPDAVSRLLGDLVVAAELLTEGLVGPSTVKISCGDAVAETLLNPQSLETIGIARCPADAPVVVSPEEPGTTRHALSTGETLVRVPAPGAGSRVAQGVDVVGTRQLTVEEIIARHQAAAARQAAVVTSSIARGTLTLTFEAPGFPAPVVISSQTTIYTGGGRTELEQRSVRVNGIEFAGGGVPRLPIIEPERVASPPLTITLTDVYTYRLRGEDELDVGGQPVRCYVVAFDPVDPSQSLFRGQAFIAADSFAMVRVEAAQTGLRGPIVSSEQRDDYRPREGGLWLLARSDVRQIYEGAGHRTPIHRVLQILAHEINPADFTARRQAAYASDAVMLRDTPEGYRYLRREPDDSGTAGRPGTAVEIEPVVTGPATRVRTLAAGVILDPNISRPLPFAGLSYVDFDLFGTGAQINAFFGGTYGQLAFSVPSMAGSRWQLAGRAFGIASSYNDRSFANGREVYEENIRQRPAHASVWLLRPLTPRIALRMGYELDYTRLTAGDTTASGFVVPADQVVHGARVAIEGQRGGWTGSLWWNPAVRSGWRAWGWPRGDDYSPDHRGFQRYGVSVARSVVLSPRLAGRLEAAWSSGEDLDRFSRYSFGTFDNRLRGYPSALIRYDRGGVIRSALAWSAGRLLRIDLFLDSAHVRDPGFGPGFRNYTGLGAALEAPAPFGLLVAAEWGYGIRGVNADGGTGTHVVRLSAFKIF